MPDVKGLPYPNASAIPDGPGAFLALNSVLSQGRGFRRFATWTAMDAVGDAVTHELAIVDAIPGAWFKYDGADWVMSGTARFADATARDAALPSPAAEMLAVTADTGITYRYSGSAWVAQFDDTGWVTLPLTAGWTGETNNIPQYRRLNRVVYIRGRAAHSSGMTGVVANLPSGSWPGTSGGATNPSLFQVDATSAARMAVHIDGTVNLFTNTSTNLVSFGGIPPFVVA